MRLVRDLENFVSPECGIALTVGNFDGLHLGHQEVLEKLIGKARSLGIPASAMCFEPQPMEFFAGKSPARLSRFRDKFIGFLDAGIDILFCQRFNESFAEEEPEDFVRKVLVSKLHVKIFIIGDDFHFGRKGRGDYALLVKLGKEYGFTVNSIDSFTSDHVRISSTLIRKYLAEGLLDNVKPLLGEPFFIRGKVCHGEERGRTIGFPTANIRLARRVTPISGVYAVRVQLPSGEMHNGIADIGCRPTVDGKEQRLEVFIFDFNGDLYRREIKVSFIKKLRCEIKFSSLDLLRKQLELDEKSARAIL